MIPEPYLLDTSALFAFIEDEPGADRVEEVLKGSSVYIPWIALLEVYYITRRERGQAEADRRYALVRQLPATIVWELNEPVLLTAGNFKSSYNMSLADALIAAMAARQEAVLVHKDPEFEPLAEQVRLEGLPYDRNSKS